MDSATEKMHHLHMISRAPLRASRFKDLEERFPPEPVALYLAEQRAWVRHVNTMSALTHVERSAAIFIAMMCSPDRPFCVAQTRFICRQVGCERTVIFRMGRVLKEAALMDIEHRKRAGNIYRILPVA